MTEGTGARTVLLTGASGVIGRAVARELKGHRVIGLAHSDTDVPEVDEILRADQAKPFLGLPRERWDRLVDEVDVIIHSGALTVWGQPRERYQAINIDGTRRIVELAQAAGAPVHLISTCFVRAIERDALDMLGPTNVVSPYIQSKLESEQLLAESGVPHSIYRPTNLVGDSVTGASSRPQIVQTIADWFCRGKAKYFPAHPGNLIDVVPLDTTAVAIARAVEADDLGQLYWLTVGETALSIEETQEILIDHARSLGRDVPPVPIVDPREPLPIPLEAIPPTSRNFVKVLIDVSEVTAAAGGSLPTSMPELQDKYGMPPVADRVAFRRSLAYWARMRGQQPRQATNQEPV